MPKTISADQVFAQQTIATLPNPWSAAFLPDGQLLVSERPSPAAGAVNPTTEGHIRLVTTAGSVSSPLTGLPTNIGVLDITLSPTYAQDHTIYFSFMESDPNAPRVGRNAADPNTAPAGLAVAKAVLDLSNPNAPALSGMSVIWRQAPEIVAFAGSGEPGGRIVFSPDGAYLFITAGDRQEFDYIQSLNNTIGKIVRIKPDGSIPTDNPFVNVPGADPAIWTLGHRNPYGLLFDTNGVLWSNEMGPKGGDELNVITRGANYGWPNVSYGNNYDGSPIPKPAPGDGYAGSALWWDPVIAPSDMIQYTGAKFSDWTGDFILSGLQSHGLVIVDPEGTSASEVGRIDLGARTRDVVQGPDGSLWVLYDQPDGRLVKLTPLAVAANSVAGDVTSGGNADLLWRHAGGTVTTWTSGGTSFADAPSFGRQVTLDWTIAGTGDFNGNGKSDVLWRNANGTVTTWLSNGTSFVDNDGAIYRKVSADWIVAGTGDFNGDGRTDIVWRNVDGTITDWLSTGVGFADNPAAGRVAGATVHIAGTGDFDGDGKDDILFRANDGGVSIWRSTGTAFVDASGFSRAMGLGWQIAGTGDFNADGKTDILWRNADGTVTDWLSSGTAFTDNNALSRTMGVDWHVAAIGDYNGDGKDDIVWRNADGRVAEWLSTGTGFADNAGAARSAPAAWSIQQPAAGGHEHAFFAQADFNGDGKDDILWQHATGTVTEWFGSATSFVDNGSLARIVSPDWQITALGDFNGDGKDDILWRASDGTMIDWLSTGTGFADNAASVHAVGVEWRVEGAADFNGDGKDDILWRNADGTVTDWISNGSNFNDNSAFYRKVSLDWHIEASADFNGDGKADILWRNDDGTVTTWLSNGSSFVDNPALSRIVPVDWQIAGVGDFNGDGNADILWRNANGTVTDWLANATGFADNPAVSRVVPLEWQILSTGDYNGDGRDDILWRATDGTLIDWLSNGTGFVDNSASARGVTLDWSVQHDHTTLLI